MSIKVWIASRLPYITRTLTPILGTRRAQTLLARVSEDLIPIAKQKMPSGRDVMFYCPSDLLIWRADTFFSKEPETLEWIDGFNAEEVFWDIGANVGLYSMYAGIEKGCKVSAFEPVSINYAILNKNISINNMDNNVKAYCIAFSDVTEIGDMNLSSTGMGTALHNFGKAEDWKGDSYTPSFRQGAVAFRIDDYIEFFKLDVPNHIKIDVDGLEGQIISGAEKTLSDSRLKTLSIELDANLPEVTEPIVHNIEKSGLKFVEKRHAELDNNNPFAGIYNYYFKR